MGMRKLRRGPSLEKTAATFKTCAPANGMFVSSTSGYHSLEEHIMSDTKTCTCNPCTCTNCSNCTCASA
jgi:hypothetical protein